MTGSTKDWFTGVLTVQESILILTILVDLTHEFATLLNFSFIKEDVDSYFLFSLESLPNDLNELMESEITGNQLPKRESEKGELTFPARDLTESAQKWPFQ